MEENLPTLPAFQTASSANRTLRVYASDNSSSRAPCLVKRTAGIHLTYNDYARERNWPITIYAPFIRFKRPRSISLTHFCQHNVYPVRSYYWSRGSPVFSNATVAIELEVAFPTAPISISHINIPGKYVRRLLMDFSTDPLLQGTDRVDEDPLIPRRQH